MSSHTFTSVFWKWSKTEGSTLFGPSSNEAVFYLLGGENGLPVVGINGFSIVLPLEVAKSLARAILELPSEPITSEKWQLHLARMEASKVLDGLKQEDPGQPGGVS